MHYYFVYFLLTQILNFVLVVWLNRVVEVNHNCLVIIQYVNKFIIRKDPIFTRDVCE